MIKTLARAWINHAALNLGSALRCLYHATIPPHVDHAPETVRSLASSSPVREFLCGLGLDRNHEEQLPDDCCDCFGEGELPGLDPEKCTTCNGTGEHAEFCPDCRGPQTD